jgi:hypothetical protein
MVLVVVLLVAAVQLGIGKYKNVILMDFENFYQFIKRETGYEINNCSPNWRIENDFNIYGDDAVEFIMKFSNEFNIDISSFNFNHHFSPESDKVSLFFLTLLKKIKVKDLAINDLKQAIELGKLE